MKEVGWALDLTAYVDPEPVGAPILEAAGIPMDRAFASVAELIAAGPFDLLMIGSPNHLHFEHLTAALDTGWSIFTEKVPSSRLDLSNTGMCGSIPWSWTSHSSIGADP
ncbi:MAG: Gfo/Idh/MocA family oxidoreductase [Pseudomonadota bacterium]|nr:Gfo/Idh/MocA family oxidoreductase [Pseudomonadota bacterium]